MIATVRITGMQFHSYHGCYAYERETGGSYVVDVIAELDVSKAAMHDELDGTINYELIFQAVAEEMKTPSNLIEHVGFRILESLKSKFPQVIKWEITVHKIQPPVGGNVDETSVTLRSE